MSIAVVLLMMVYVYCCADNTGSDKFVPTSEWSEINEGQSIGKGLHVRLNLETGKKEAKLLIPDERNDGGANSVVVVDDEVVEATLNDMEEGLKHVASSRDTAETLSQKFRTLEELRSVLPNLELKTEGQQLNDAVVRLNETSQSDVTSLLIALESIEDLAHKYDNGLLLVTEGWMGVVGSLLHHPDENVYRAALRVISSAAQSNPSVQKHCIESGYLSFLLPRIPLQNDKLAKSTVFCVGAMVRNFPAALQTFSHLSSYQILADKLVTSTLPSLQRVILSLFNDLLNLDTQLGTDVVEKSIMDSVSSDDVLCSKLSDIILGQADYDLIREVAVFHSRIRPSTRHWCRMAGPHDGDPDFAHTIKKRLLALHEEYGAESGGEITELISRLEN